MKNHRALELSLTIPTLSAWIACLLALNGTSPTYLISTILLLTTALIYYTNQHYQTTPKHAKTPAETKKLLLATTAAILLITTFNAHLHHQHYQNSTLIETCLNQCQIEIIAQRAPNKTTKGYQLPARLNQDQKQQLTLTGKELGKIKTNDKVLVKGQLKKDGQPPNQGTFKVKEHHILKTSFAHQVADHLQTHLDNTQSSALIRAMTIGDLSGLEQTTRTQIRHAGAAHLIAISGLHLAILMATTQALIPGKPRRKTKLTLLGLAIVIISVGWQPSVLRATTMLGLTSLGAQLKRHTQGINSLAIVILIWLTYDPWLAYSTGFLLSALATLAVLGVTITGQKIEHFENETTIRKYWLLLRPIILVPIYAQLVTSAVTVSQMGSYATYGIFVNILLTPLVPLITGGGIFILLTSLISPTLATWLGQIVKVFAQLELDLISFTAQLPGAHLEGESAWWALIGQYTLVGFSLICHRGMRSYLYGSKTQVRKK
ncbi:ComEC/Rec2 family competence protein [Gleimia sp. 6138-11-ORH1]|uniref:ComEC/Rec2 family competence protein n=1 Tax=Gleimia sp. 6138-11-ORH1 TaxID=2973937 RepID=UPI00216A99D1|nr:ComEC/Rec2 family competence protein [Gleimia sp. 6138-11-ORH1]MCS4484166.1 ComEC/Rec2 family competence protein [Gleimia sp. 6138-11-ORH1]